MTGNDTPAAEVTAALLIIGEEILSGRTADLNTPHIGKRLAETGIVLREVRVVADVEEEIAAAVNALRARYRYLFTTGGIGSTHDDVTTDAIGLAFGVEVEEDPRAVQELQQRYPGEPLSPGRLRMARIPNGAVLVRNPVSGAPGFMIGNVIVMAGIPRIMQAMLENILPQLETGARWSSRAVRIDAPEGEVAGALRRLQSEHPKVRIGSYPFFEAGRVGTYVVLRGAALAAVEAALAELWRMIGREGFAAFRADDSGTYTIEE